MEVNHDRSRAFGELAPLGLPSRLIEAAFDDLDHSSGQSISVPHRWSGESAPTSSEAGADGDNGGGVGGFGIVGGVGSTFTPPARSRASPDNARRTWPRPSSITSTIGSTTFLDNGTGVGGIGTGVAVGFENGTAVGGFGTGVGVGFDNGMG